ncbi:NUDIX hydrolase [Endozoicomonas arenosclerae]|uniref:NUDIX hydrolase n=1 Tax=Endozoicomonas arenosclerae TaxID=1633495 RepID=UPI000786658F|nr:NUDIX hydrolase [Endozoicomonas arenosclerae]
MNNSSVVAEPRLAATVVILRDGPKGLETLIMRKNSRANFLGGFWVFPGGSVEEQDQADTSQQTLKNAAARETKEEAALDIDPDELIYISRWITPETAPKRFDTHFFLAPARSSEVIVDGGEIVDADWVTPAEAISRQAEKEIEMMPPTLVTFHWLQQCSTVAEAIRHFKDRKPVEFLPKANFADEQLVMLYPGDAGYDSGDPDVVGTRHRCLLVEERWRYLQTKG